MVLFLSHHDCVIYLPLSIFVSHFSPLCKPRRIVFSVHARQSFTLFSIGRPPRATFLLFFVPSESKAMSIRCVFRCYNLAYREESEELLHESLCIPTERAAIISTFFSSHSSYEDVLVISWAQKRRSRWGSFFIPRRAFHFRTSLGFQFRDATFYLSLIRNRRLPCRASFSHASFACNTRLYPDFAPGTSSTNVTRSGI